MAACVNPLYLHKRELYVPCGMCGYCLKNKKEDWLFRIKDEQKYADSTYFVTLTYADDYVPIQNGTGIEILDKKDLQKFFKRLRKRHATHSKSQIRYYAVGEYGTQFLRPHYHAIIFNAVYQDIEKAWPLGHVQNEVPHFGAIGYVVGYISSVDNDSVTRGVPKQFAIMSRKPGLGYRYLQSHKQWHTQGLRNYSKINGIGGRLPRYYKKLMFDDNQRNILSENAKEAYETQYLNLYHHFKDLDYPNPAAAVTEMIQYNEQTLLKQINERKKKI